MVFFFVASSFLFMFKLYRTEQRQLLIVINLCCSKYDMVGVSKLDKCNSIKPPFKNGEVWM